ncbi:MAG: hypothetical protein JXA60_07630 [Candidatus Coatesbacteria bacterium]|nr:hypothetical protein [Candidatus Coatesbacteria bacterium]
MEIFKLLVFEIRYQLKSMIFSGIISVFLIFFISLRNVSQTEINYNDIIISSFIVFSFFFSWSFIARFLWTEDKEKRCSLFFTFPVDKRKIALFRFLTPLFLQISFIMLFMLSILLFNLSGLSIDLNIQLMLTISFLILIFTSLFLLLREFLDLMHTMTIMRFFPIVALAVIYLFRYLNFPSLIPEGQSNWENYLFPFILAVIYFSIISLAFHRFMTRKEYQ